MNAKLRKGISPVRDAFVAWAEAVGSSSERTIPGKTLGDALTSLIDWLSRPEGTEMRSVLSQGRGKMYVDLITEDGYEPRANDWDF